jgi:hypothetical protein
LYSLFSLFYLYSCFGFSYFTYSLKSSFFFIELPYFTSGFSAGGSYSFSGDFCLGGAGGTMASLEVLGDYLGPKAG